MSVELNVVVGMVARRVLRASEAELMAHESRLDAIAKAAKKPALWRTLDA